ncbi:MAG TPA: hypothetical protein VGE85_11480 [Terracidiphilus sp.]|jgi:hypothetical protein
MAEVLNLLGLAFIAGGVWSNFNYMRKNMVTKDGLRLAIQDHELACEQFNPKKEHMKAHAAYTGAGKGEITEY